MRSLFIFGFVYFLSITSCSLSKSNFQEVEIEDLELIKTGHYKHRLYFKNNLLCEDSIDFKAQRELNENDLFSRAVLVRNIKPIMKRSLGKSGKIKYNVCVNQKGKVIEGEQISNTVSESEKDQNLFTQYIMGYQYEADSLAPCKECGMLTIKIDNFKGIR